VENSALLDLGLEFLQFGQKPRQLGRLRAAWISTRSDFTEVLSPLLAPLGVPFGSAHQPNQDN
jgi:hypothetical protein